MLKSKVCSYDLFYVCTSEVLQEWQRTISKKRRSFRWFSCKTSLIGSWIDNGWLLPIILKQSFRGDESDKFLSTKKRPVRECLVVTNLSILLASVEIWRMRILILGKESKRQVLLKLEVNLSKVIKPLRHFPC